MCMQINVNKTLIPKYQYQYNSLYEKEKPLYNTLNWGNWNSGFVKFGVGAKEIKIHKRDCFWFQSKFNTWKSQGLFLSCNSSQLSTWAQKCHQSLPWAAAGSSQSKLNRSEEKHILQFIQSGKLWKVENFEDRVCSRLQQWWFKSKVRPTWSSSIPRELSSNIVFEIVITLPRSGSEWPFDQA